MSAPPFRVVTWNMEWRRPGSSAAAMMLQRIAECEPDIVCLTEAYVDVLEGWGGAVIAAEADYGYPLTEGRRKVLLWSRTSWNQVDRIGSAGLPSGRYVSGCTTTSFGALHVIGVCIPWQDAHVRTGRKNRTSWQDHCTYLEGLGPLLARTRGPCILLGDFNQTIPRRRAPEPVHAALVSALDAGALHLATGGVIDPCGQALIDHIALSPELRAGQVRSLDRFDPAGKALSDHWGVAAELRVDAPAVTLPDQVLRV